MIFSAIVVDDEKDAREGLALLLQQDERIRLLALCDDGLAAIAEIEKHKPDILFLDVQMPQVNGFEVLRSIQFMPKAVIFVTAYDEFALKAFEVHAIDYLLKPFTDSRFFKALDHAKEMVTRNPMESHRLINSLPPAETTGSELLGRSLGERLVVKENGRIQLIPYRDIHWLEAYDYYVKIHLGDRFYLIRESLKKLSHKLQAYGFVRIHKSTVVNLKYATTVKQLSQKGYVLVLKNGQELGVSRSHRKALFDLLNHS